MVKVVVGMMGSSVMGGSSRMASPDQVREFLSVLKRHHVQELDTARVYNGGKSEELLGAVGAGKDFAVSTKAPGFSSGVLAGHKIIASCNASLKALQQDKMDIFYFHGPDRETPLEEQCKAANQLYAEGKFERFGVSNLRVDEVQTIHDICKREGYMLPTVYQGGYNPISRSAEELLFPTLRKLGIAYYAFSPLGGGFFSKPIEELRNPPKGTRMDEMKVFKDIYVNETSLEKLTELTELCRKHDILVKEATMRWFMHHAPLEKQDAVILGASSAQQVEETLTACEAGPLPEEVVASFASMWEACKEQPWLKKYCA